MVLLLFQDQDIDPRHLAIDKPSFKFSQFLQKHYNLKAELPQVNNFVVYEGFFSSLTSQDNSRGRRGYSRPPLHPNTNCKDWFLVEFQFFLLAQIHEVRIIDKDPTNAKQMCICIIISHQYKS